MSILTRKGFPVGSPLSVIQGFLLSIFEGGVRNVVAH